MKFNSKLSLWVLAAVFPAAVSAEVIPAGSSRDGRIQTVAYTPNDVVHIRARVGDATLIQLEEGERISGDTGALGMGDADAWKVAVRGNNIIFKPAAVSPSSNMIITTNKKRTYVFKLSASAKRAGNKIQDTTYLLRFVYPDTVSRKARDEAQKYAKALERLQQAGYRPNAKHNYNYWGKGHKALAPTAAYDNGRFTYFSFDNGRELPLIYKVMDDGSEMLLNSHVDGDTVVIHETAKRYVLRLGKSVLGLENRSFNERGTFNRTGSGSSNTVRISKGK